MFHLPLHPSRQQQKIACIITLNGKTQIHVIFTCNYCQRPFDYTHEKWDKMNWSTGNVKQHVMKKHQAEWQQVEMCLLINSKPSNNATNYANSNTMLTTATTANVAVQEALEDFLIETTQPFDLVDKPSFRRFVDLCLQVKIDGVHVPK